MAIDTAHKRFSIMLGAGLLGWPPDGTISAADRAIMLEWYSGISAGAPAGAGQATTLLGLVEPSPSWLGLVEPSPSWLGLLLP